MQWIFASLTIGLKKLSTVKSRVRRSDTHGRSFGNGARKYLRFLHSKLVIVPVDKAFNDAMFVCKHLYLSLLKEDFSLNGAYVVENRSGMEVLESHRAFLGPRCLEGPSKFGYLYAAPKMHKPNPAQRFIAAMFECSLTLCARILHAALEMVLVSLREKDVLLLNEFGYKRFFVVDGYEMVAHCLSSYHRSNSSTPALFSGDFSTMYTSIPHQDSLARINQTCSEAWSFESERKGYGGSLYQV